MSVAIIHYVLHTYSILLGMIIHLKMEFEVGEETGLLVVTVKQCEERETHSFLDLIFCPNFPVLFLWLMSIPTGQEAFANFA